MRLWVILSTDEQAAVVGFGRVARFPGRRRRSPSRGLYGCSTDLSGVNVDDCPPGAFADPTGDNAAAVRAVYECAVERLLEAVTGAADRPPLQTDPQVPDATIPRTPSEWPALEKRLMAVVEGSMNPAHPGYIGHMDSLPTTASVVGDAVAAALNNNMLSVELSPVLSRLEADVVSEFADRFGLGPDAGGLLVSGGSLANLQALAVARNRALGGVTDGVVGTEGRPVLFASDVAHTSLRTAAMVLGLGTDAVVAVETDADSRMRAGALRTAIERAFQRGDRPFCVVGTAGTTTTGNVDPLDDIAAVAAASDLWFHVDAAYGGALVFSAAERSRLDGVERADSVTFNPQKWLYVAKTCSMALFRDASVLDSQFRVGAPYMRRDERLWNRGEVGVQGTRHADVLKLWLSLQHVGERGYEGLIDESYRLTDHFVSRVREREWLELASDPELNLICFRVAPDGVDESAYDELNGTAQRSLLREADVFLSLPTYRGSRWLRAVLLNPYTDEAVIDRLFDHLDGVVQRRR
jgi:glutamate/tyrosine decarboxylase-like PLP-dependent enzyme